MNEQQEVKTTEMKEAAARFEQWRRSAGGRGSRVPEQLWQVAADVARRNGVYATARALRLNYSRLSKQVGGTKVRAGKRTSVASAKPKATGPSPAFIDLGPAALGSGPRMVIELEGRGGERLKIDVAGGSSVDVVGLAQMFWSRNP